MTDKLLPQLFGIPVHKEAELGQDGEPDVVWTDYEGMMSIVALDDGVHEAVGVWYNVLTILICLLIKRGLEYLAAFLELVVASAAQNSSHWGLFYLLGPLSMKWQSIGTMFSRLERHGHSECGFGPRIASRSKVARPKIRVSDPLS